MKLSQRGQLRSVHRFLAREDESAEAGRIGKLAWGLTAERKERVNLAAIMHQA